MCQGKLRTVMKAFIESQFDYCPLVWMFHSRDLNNRINRLHERAIRLVYKNNNLTFEELLKKDKSFSIQHRNIQKLATEMYKVKNNLSPTLMKFIFPEREIPYNLRNLNPFQVTNVNTVFHGIETIAFRGPKVWGMVHKNIKNLPHLVNSSVKLRTGSPGMHLQVM